MRPPLLAVLLLPAACAAPPSSEPPSQPPRDLSLDLTVMADPDAVLAAAVVPPAARFVVFPDGTLHYAPGAPAGAASLPPAVRRLEPRQVADLWAMLRASDLADPEAADPMRNVIEVAPVPGGATCLLAVTCRDRRWLFVRDAAPDEPLDPDLRALADRLAELAWANEEASDGFGPIRYDLGPDPYARYRRP